MTQASMDFVRGAIAEMYRGITGRECSVDVFVVRKDSALGCYTVHPIPSGDFYLVTVKKLLKERHDERRTVRTDCNREFRGRTVAI